MSSQISKKRKVGKVVAEEAVPAATSSSSTDTKPVTVKATDLLAKAEAASYATATPDKEDSLEYDVGNLSAFDPNPFNAESTDYESSLLEASRDNVQLLLNKIFDLPSENMPGDMGRLAVLPKTTTPLPREKPIPKPKAPTKWEQFAQLKGIVKRKRSRMVFDEDTQEYKPRFGYKRANDPSQQLVIEHKEGEDPSIDPWTRMAQEKKARIEKNKKQQQRNLQKASGTRLPGTIDLSSAVQSKPGSKKKHHVDLALQVAQRSTASMGEFDRARRNETLTARKNTSLVSGKDQSLKLLSRVLGSGDRDAEVNEGKLSSVGQQMKENKNRVAKNKRDNKRQRKG